MGARSDPSLNARYDRSKRVAVVNHDIGAGLWVALRDVAARGRVIAPVVHLARGFRSTERLGLSYALAPRAICVGINPSPVSVAVGHYYQGRQGQRFVARLVQAGLLLPARDAFDDDAAFIAGVGFTDVVKRPTARANEVSSSELRIGRDLLAAKLANLGTPPLIFPFKAGAVALVGAFNGNGRLEQRFAGSRLFVMPGPYERRASADATIATLGPQLP